MGASADTDKAPAQPLTCRGGQQIVAFVTEDDCYVCDLCKYMPGSGVSMWGCRSCGFDICADCFSKAPLWCSSSNTLTSPFSPLPSLLCKLGGQSCLALFASRSAALSKTIECHAPENGFERVCHDAVYHQCSLEGILIAGAQVKSFFDPVIAGLAEDCGALVMCAPVKDHARAEIKVAIEHSGEAQFLSDVVRAYVAVSACTTDMNPVEQLYRLAEAMLACDTFSGHRVRIVGLKDNLQTCAGDLDMVLSLKVDGFVCEVLLGFEEAFAMWNDTGRHIHEVSRKRNDALLFAAMCSDGAAVSGYIADGADVNGSHDARRFTALHHAAQRGNIQIVSALLDSRADPLALDKEGLFPLCHALRCGSSNESTNAILDAMDALDRRPSAEATAISSMGGFEVILTAALQVLPGAPAERAAVFALRHCSLDTLLPRVHATRGCTVEAFAWVGGQAVPVLEHLLVDADCVVRRWAVWTLGNIGAPSLLAVPILCTLLRRDSDAVARRHAAEVLGVLHAVEAAGELEMALRQDACAEVRWWAAWSLGALGLHSSVLSLAQALAVDRAEAVRRNAAEALGRLSAAEAIQPLEAALRGDASPDVRCWAARSLARVGGSAVLSLAAVLSDVSLGDSRWRAIEALRGLALDEPRALSALEGALASREADVRRRAAEALGAVAAQSSLPALEAAARRKGEGPLVRAFILDALQKVRANMEESDFEQEEDEHGFGSEEECATDEAKPRPGG